jgi:hypothetical protein
LSKEPPVDTGYKRDGRDTGIIKGIQGREGRGEISGR